MKPFQPAKYSFRWAMNIVREVKLKYARGTETAEKILGITDQNLGKYIATGDPLWNNLRDFIKFCDKTVVRGRAIVSDYEIAIRYRNLVSRRGPERLVKPLTAYLDRAMLEEQVEKGSSGGLQADGTPPYVLEDGLVQYTLEF